MLGLFGSSLKASRPISSAPSFKLGSGLTSRGVASQVSPKPSRFQKYARRTAYFAIGLGAAYTADRNLYASTTTRNLRTFYTVRRVRLPAIMFASLHRSCEERRNTSLNATSTSRVEVLICLGSISACLCWFEMGRVRQYTL